MKIKSDQMYYLALPRVKALLARKKGSPDFMPVPLEVTEISPLACCFELEGEQIFNFSEELELFFRWADHSRNLKATVVSIEPSTFWDEGYEYTVWHSYRAEFQGALDGGLFRSLAGCPKKKRR